MRRILLGSLIGCRCHRRIRISLHRGINPWLEGAIRSIHHILDEAIIIMLTVGQMCPDEDIRGRLSFVIGDTPLLLLR
jgi:hypothetical protein